MKRIKKGFGILIVLFIFGFGLVSCIKDALTGSNEKIDYEYELGRITSLNMMGYSIAGYDLNGSSHAHKYILFDTERGIVTEMFITFDRRTSKILSGSVSSYYYSKILENEFVDENGLHYRFETKDDKEVINVYSGDGDKKNTYSVSDLGRTVTNLRKVIDKTSAENALKWLVPKDSPLENSRKIA